MNSIRFLRLDLLAIKPYFKSLYFYFILLGIGVISKNSSLVFSMTFVPLLIYISYPFAVAERGGLERLYLSMPIKRSDIVKARYLLSLLMVVMAYLVTFIMMLVMVLLGAEFKISEEMIGFAVLSIFYLWIFSLQAPIWFKKGYMKARLTTMMPYFIIGLIFPVIVTMSDKAVVTEIINKIKIFVETTPGLTIASYAILVTALFLTISYQLSVKFYKQKEF